MKRDELVLLSRWCATLVAGCLDYADLVSMRQTVTSWRDLKASWARVLVGPVHVFPDECPCSQTTARLLAACEPAQARDIHLRAWDDGAQDDLVRGVQHFKALQRLRLSFRTFVSLPPELNLDDLRVLIMHAPNFKLQTLDVSPWPRLPNLETFELEETTQRGLVVSRTSNFFYQTAWTVLQAVGTRLRQVSLVRSKEMFDKDKSSSVPRLEPAVLDCLTRQELQSLTLPFLVVTRLPYPSLRADVLTSVS